LASDRLRDELSFFSVFDDRRKVEQDALRCRVVIEDGG
jgi:hypothetical protein